MKRATLVCWALVAGAAAAAPPRVAEVRAGPYRIVVDRVSHSRSTTAGFDEKTGDPNPLEIRRQVQVQIGVFADDAASASSIATFQLNALLCRRGRRMEEIAHYGGKLESANDRAALRAYVYAPVFPPEPTEIAAIEGEILAFDKSTTLTLTAAANKTFPQVATDGDVKLTVKELTRDGDHARVVLETEVADGISLAAPGVDGTHGVELLSTDGLPATSVGGTLVQTRPNRLEYRIGFLRLRGDPGTIRVKVVRQTGSRKSYPFRLERIPIPTRADVLAAPKT